MRRNPHFTNTDDHKRAIELRRSASSVEQKFWFALRQATLKTKIKFRFQQPIRPYIVDFACMKAKLLVELDGMSHDAQPNYDRKREAYLQKQGYLVIHISNSEAMNNLQNVVEGLVRQAEELLKQSDPLTSKN